MNDGLWEFSLSTFDLLDIFLYRNHLIEGHHFGLFHIFYFLCTFYLFLQNMFVSFFLFFQGKYGKNFPTLRLALTFVIHLLWMIQDSTGFWELRCLYRVQFSSVLCDLMYCSMPGLPVHHQHMEFTQTHVHRVSDAIQPSHPLSSPHAPNPSQHQSLFQWVNSSHDMAKVLEFQL